jgi:hypothetical protein
MLPKISQEEYVQYVAERLGFHTPPAYVREKIEFLWRERVSVYGAENWMRGYLTPTSGGAQ